MATSPWRCECWCGEGHQGVVTHGDWLPPWPCCSGHLTSLQSLVARTFPETKSQDEDEKAVCLLPRQVACHHADTEDSSSPAAAARGAWAGTATARRDQDEGQGGDAGLSRCGGPSRTLRLPISLILTVGRLSPPSSCPHSVPDSFHPVPWGRQELERPRVTTRSASPRRTPPLGKVTSSLLAAVSVPKSRLCLPAQSAVTPSALVPEAPR